MTVSQDWIVNIVSFATILGIIFFYLIPKINRRIKYILLVEYNRSHLNAIEDIIDELKELVKDNSTSKADIIQCLNDLSTELEKEKRQTEADEMLLNIKTKFWLFKD